MRASVSLSMIAVAALAVAGSAHAHQPPDMDQQTMAKKPKSSPAVVVISVDDEGHCHVLPKSVTIVAKDAPQGTRGPRKVRFFYARGDGDRSKVKLSPDPQQTYPGILGLPQLGEGQSMGDSSESKEAFEGDEYRFVYAVELDIDGETVSCDPDVVIRKGGG